MLGVVDKEEEPRRTLRRGLEFPCWFRWQSWSSFFLITNNGEICFGKASLPLIIIVTRLEDRQDWGQEW